MEEQGETDFIKRGKRDKQHGHLKKLTLVSSGSGAQLTIRLGLISAGGIDAHDYERQ